MFKRIFIYCVLGLIAGYYISGQTFSAPSLFKDWQVVQLVWAAKNGNIQKIDKLIAEGIDVNAVGEIGFTPLSWIFLYIEPNPDVKAGFKHLLINGASVSQHLNFADTTMLHFAASAQDSEYLKMILEHAKDVKIDDNRFGDTPLIESMSIDHHSHENFEVLIKNNANINTPDSSNNTALTISSRVGMWRYALALIEHGADYNEGAGVITAGNKKGFSQLVRNIENSRYWPEVAIESKGHDYREDVINFLRDKGVEVYPWYPEDDPRHNPRPVQNPATLFDAPFDFKENQQNKAEYESNYKLALRFLNLLQRTEEAERKPVDKFITDFALEHPKMLTAIMNEEGVYVYKSDGKVSNFYTLKEIETQLEDKSGAFFDLLAQLSYHYSQPYPQYNSTRYMVDESEQYLFIRRGGSYGFLFTNEKNPKLLRIESYHIADL